MTQNCKLTFNLVSIGVLPLNWSKSLVIKDDHVSWRSVVLPNWLYPGATCELQQTEIFEEAREASSNNSVLKGSSHMSGPRWSNYTKAIKWWCEWSGGIWSAWTSQGNLLFFRGNTSPAIQGSESIMMKIPYSIFWRVASSTTWIEWGDWNGTWLQCPKAKRETPHHPGGIW